MPYRRRMGDPYWAVGDNKARWRCDHDNFIMGRLWGFRIMKALRKLPFDLETIGKSIVVDHTIQSFNRQERYQIEKQMKHGVLPFEEKYMTNTKYAEREIQEQYEKEYLFWDVLKDAGHECALYLVLRHCLGYSCAEIAAGLETTYSRVRYMTLKERRKW